MRFLRAFWVCGVVSSLLVGHSWGHVSYTGRDIIADGLAEGNRHTLSGLRVTSNYGWADAADADWGDSHRGRFLKFSVEATSNVDILVKAQSGVTYVSNGQELTALDDLIPALSLYSGLVPQLSHESSDHPLFVANHPGFLPDSPYYDAAHPGDKEGAWISPGDFSMGTVLAEMADPSLWDAKQIQLVNWAIDGAGVDLNGDGLVEFAGDGVADQWVSRSFVLEPGDYTLVVGGACYACQDPLDANYLAQRAFTASVTVNAVPEPAGIVLLAMGGLMATLRRRSR